MSPRSLLLGASVAASLCTCAAQAATKPVSMGPPAPKSGPSQFQKLNGDVNNFFPSTITIHAGDTVKFVPNGFHTVDIPAKGGKPYDLFVPGDPVAGANDAAGSPFWFNGQPSLGLNGSVFGANNYGKTVTYTPAKGVESGAPLGDKLKPMAVKFTKAGTVHYVCDIHPGMRGTVKVLPKGAKGVRSAKADAAAVATQVKRALAELEKIQRFKPGSGVIQIGNAGKGQVESYDFFPKATTVKVGTTVTFQMPSRSTEVHTATAGPGNPLAEEQSYLGKLANSFNGPAPDPAAVYSSEQPGGTPAGLTTTLHGNGFWNAGVLDDFAASPNPRTNQVTFAEAGKFDFYCMIHPFMKTTVTVTS